MDDYNGGLTANKVALMIEVHNFFQRPENKHKRFKSLNHIGQCFHNNPNVPPQTKLVLKFMLDAFLIRVTDENALNLDVSAFEKFIEHTKNGQLWINYVDEKSTLRVP
jgi:hypothetical protein